MTTASTASTAGTVANPPAQEELVSLPYAGFGLRLVAAVLDIIVLFSVFLLFASMAGFYLLLQTDWGRESDFSTAEQNTAFAILSVYLLFLPVYFIALWWWHGQTIGQMATRIAITDRDGYHIAGWRAIVRTIFWPLSVIPLGLGLVPIFFDDESRALHDMIAGTVVLELP
jgi:uncharacterized RDD family membrane protein YckC